MSAAPAPRQVSVLERGVEDRLVAMLDAVGGLLPRREIFDRFDDDFVNEEDLARCLGRLVADGRLVRQMRPRFGKPDEAVYGTGNVVRLAAIAEAAGKARPPAKPAADEVAVIAKSLDLPVATVRQDLSADVCTPPKAPKAPTEKENDMGKSRKSPAEIQEAVKGAVLGAREPLSLADVAKAAGVSPGSAKRALQGLAKGPDRVVSCSGKGRATRWQAAAATPAHAASSPLTKSPAKASAPPSSTPNGVVFAIESTGALAISSTTGPEKTRIEPGDVAALAEFLAITRPIWESPAP